MISESEYQSPPKTFKGDLSLLYQFVEMLSKIEFTCHDNDRIA